MNTDGRFPSHWPVKETLELEPGLTMQLLAKGLRKERTGLHGQLGLRINDVAVAVDSFNFERMKGGRSDFVAAVLKRLADMGQGVAVASLTNGTLAVAVDRFCLGCINRLTEGEPFLVLGQHEPELRPYLLENVLREGETTRLFGEKGSGKSFLATVIAMSLQTGRPLLGLGAAQGPTLYLDWEADAETLDARLFALSRGFGLEEVPPVLYRRMTLPLAEDLDSVTAALSEHAIRLIIADSAGLAGDPSEPESASSALSLAAALRRLGRTSLIVDHVSKDSTAKKKTPYGSVYKINTDRSVFEVRSAQDEHTGALHIGLFHRWANNARLGRPLGWALRVDDRTATFTPEDLRDVPLLEENLSAGTRAWAALTKPMTTTALAEELGLPPDTLAKACQRHPGITKAGGGGRGSEVLWARLAEAMT